VTAGFSRHTISVPREDDVFPRLLYSDSRCSQTCCWGYQAWCQGFQVLSGLLSALPSLLPVLPGAVRCTQSSLWHSEVFLNLSQSLPLYSSTSHQRSQLLWRLAEMPTQGLILSRNCHIRVFTPHPPRFCWRLPVTKRYFADTMVEGNRLLLGALLGLMMANVYVWHSINSPHTSETPLTNR